MAVPLNILLGLDFEMLSGLVRLERVVGNFQRAGEPRVFAAVSTRFVRIIVGLVLVLAPTIVG